MTRVTGKDTTTSARRGQAMHSWPRVPGPSACGQCSPTAVSSCGQADCTLQPHPPAPPALSLPATPPQLTPPLSRPPLDLKCPPKYQESLPAPGSLQAMHVGETNASSPPVHSDCSQPCGTGETGDLCSGLGLWG